MEKINAAFRTRSQNDAPACGDGIGLWRKGGIVFLAIVDGLGHGPQAAKASTAVLNFISENFGAPLPELFQACDLAVRHTRGAALGAARIETDANQLYYAGIGNTRTMVFGERKIRLDGDPGIIGAGFRKLNVDSIELESGDLVFMQTDGLKRLTDPREYGGLLYGELDPLADRMFQDNYLGTDDGALLVFRY